jgi:twitching motility two-component system response regulator PilG
MNQKNFQPNEVLNNLINGNNTGYLHVISNSITWKIYLLNGKLQYAYYSLQSFKNVYRILMLNKFGATAIQLKSSPHAKEIFKRYQSIFMIIDQLVKKNLLTAAEEKVLHKELTQEAIEFFLWLREGEHQWIRQTKSQNTITPAYLWDTQELLKFMDIRLKKWQQLNPLILSPLQRPICPNPSLINNPVPEGTLPINILEKLTQLMRGVSIQELGVVMKQNELQIANVLLPYIKSQVFILQPPQAPLDKLPLIPPPQFNATALFKTTLTNLKEAHKTTLTNLQQPNKITLTNAKTSDTHTQKSSIARIEINSAQTTGGNVKDKEEEKVYKIISIDDSPTMLNTIKNYLGTEKYDVCIIENPMLSLGPIFDMKPDLILMDFSMPKINGNKLCRILRQSHILKETPIIMVSGNFQMIDKEQLYSSGITDYLAKPFSKEDLLKIVAKYLGSDE